MPAAAAYPDSSFLVSLVARDAHSADAAACLANFPAPLLFSPLHRIEARNALRNVAARGALTDRERRAAFRWLEADLRAGLLVPLPVDWTKLLRRADRLSETHAATAGQRTLDLLHVALALEAGAKTLFTFDTRQRRLALAAGLDAKP